MTVRGGPFPRPLRIAQVAPVAQSIPPARSGSVESVVALLADGLVEQGHDVTVFATADSTTRAKLHSVYQQGYNIDDSMWPWELCELFNLAAAIEHADRFDVIHYQAEYSPLSLGYDKVCPTPLVHTVHHAPDPTEVGIWSRYPEAPFIAISETQARLLKGLNVVATIHHAVDPTMYAFQSRPGDYLVFLGRFTEGKGVLEAIDIAHRAQTPLVLAAAANDYYRDVVASRVDGRTVTYAGEVVGREKVELLRNARALVYPVQHSEPFGLVLIEAMACGTPVTALRRGAVEEIVDDGVTGGIYASLNAMTADLPRVMALDRAKVRARAIERFGPARCVEQHVAVYSELVKTRHEASLDTAR